MSIYITVIDGTTAEHEKNVLEYHLGRDMFFVRTTDSIYYYPLSNILEIRIDPTTKILEEKINETEIYMDKDRSE